MKILYLISGIGPKSGWGTEYIQNLIFELSKKGVSATIITPIYIHTHSDWKNWVLLQNKRVNIKIIPFQFPNWLSRNLYLSFIFTPFFVTYYTIKLLRKERFDLIHEFSSVPFILLRALILKTWFNIPTVFTLSVYNTTILGNIFWFKFFNIARLYFFQSKEITDKVISLGINLQKVRGILPAINIAKFSSIQNIKNSRSKLNIEDGKYLISYYGPLTKEKGVEDIINMFHKYHKKLPDNFKICLFIINKGSTEHEKLKQKILNINSPAIQLIEGFIDIPTLLAASNAVILPQQTGNGATIPPISTIEVISSGTPIITTDIIGNREWVDLNNGLLIKPGDIDAMYNAIINIPKNKLKPNLKKLSVFDINKVTDDYLKCYRTIYE